MKRILVGFMLICLMQSVFMCIGVSADDGAWIATETTTAPTTQPSADEDDDGGLFGGFVEWLIKIWEGITGIPRAIGDMFSTLFGWLGEILTALKQIPKLIGDFFSDIFGWLKDLWDIISDIPNKIKDMLIELFVPTFDLPKAIKDKFEGKFPIATQGGAIMQGLFNSIGDKQPDFSFQYQGMQLKAMDFTVLDPYMPTIRGLLVVFLYLSFLSNQIKHLPRFIRGRD